MEVIVEPKDFERLDPAIRRMIDSAWETPSKEPKEAGLRRRRADFPKKAEIMAAAAAVMQEALNGEHRWDVHYNPIPVVDAFEEYIYAGMTQRAYRIIMRAWNQRRDIGTCQFCGSLLLPGKGKLAKYCGNHCRVAMSRTPEKAWPHGPGKSMFTTSIPYGPLRPSSEGA